MTSLGGVPPDDAVYEEAVTSNMATSNGASDVVVDYDSNGLAPTPIKETELTDGVSTTKTSPSESLENGEYGLTPVESNDVGQSLPTPEEIRATVNPEPANRNRVAISGKGSGMLFCFFISLLLVVILSVGLGVGLSNRGEQAHRRKTSPAEVQGYVVSMGYSLNATFSSEDSPQSKAAHWMAMEDEMNMAIPNPVVDVDGKYSYDYMLRYIMTVLYFSTGGEDWRYQFRFLSEHHTCSWNGALFSRLGVISYGLICKDGKADAIYLDNARASGELPMEFYQLKTLTWIDFNFNRILGGTLPDELCDLTQLQRLYIGFTDLRGNIPACINRLAKLEILFLPDNELEGPLPSLTGMNSLSRLFLDDNDLTGDITTAFDNLPELSFLFIEDNDFIGTIDSSFMRQNTKIVRIDISNNKLEGQLTAHFFSDFERLELLDLNGNNLTGALPEFNPQSQAMVFLALHDNEFTGPIPPSIKNLQRLSHLDLSNNDLIGDMPEEIGSMHNLTYLFLAGNRELTPGPIPATYESLVKMEEISLRGTERDGGLPEFISNWTNLVFLDLSDNGFSDTIPASYGGLTKLEFILLNKNRLLSGAVPDSFSNLENLRGVFLQESGLQGDLEHMCAMAAFNEPENDPDGSEVLVADCNEQLITCTCCICCPNEDDSRCGVFNTLNLNPQWESGYNRIEFYFGNETSFIDSDRIP